MHSIVEEVVQAFRCTIFQVKIFVRANIPTASDDGDESHSFLKGKRGFQRCSKTGHLSAA